MARRIVPRRLSHDEEASLVEHLTELRHRLVICLFAIVPAFAVAYVFHDELIARLKGLLPEGTPLVTLGVTEPFTTSLKVSFYVAIAIVLPIILWQIWAFLAPAVGEDTQRVIGIFVVFATLLFAAGVAFCYTIVLPKALTFLVDYDSELYLEQIRASYYLSFVTLTLLAFGLAFQMPIFILGLVRLGVLTLRPAAAGTAASATSSMLAFAILLPTIDPVSLVLEVVPLFVLFEALDLALGLHGAALGALGRRGRGRGSVRIVSADSGPSPVDEGDRRLVAVRAPCGAVRSDDGRIAAVGPAAELGRGERFEGCVIVPGFVNCHTHLEYAVYAGFGDGLPFSSWIGLHVERKGALDLDDMRAIATDGAFECLRSGITTVGDCSFAGATAEAAAVDRASRAIVYLEVFGHDASALERFDELHGRVSHLASERLVLGISPHAPYTCTRELYEACAALGLPQATHLAESVAEREFLVDGTGDWSAVRADARPAARGHGHPHARRRGAARPVAHGRALRPRRRRGDRAPRRARRRRRALPALERVPRLRRRAASPSSGPRGSPSASRPTAPRRRRRSTSSTSSGRRSSRRARASSGPTRSPRATRSSSRRSAARACSGWTAEVGSLVPGKQADLAVVSLDGQPVRAC